MSSAGCDALVGLALVALVATTGRDAGAQKPSLDPELTRLYETYRACQAGGRPCPPFDAARVSESGEVLIEAVASADASALKADLVALGLRDAVMAGRIVSGWLPIPAIPRLSGLPTMQFARPALWATQGSSGRGQ